MIEDKTPMYVTYPGWLLLDKEINNLDIHTYAVITAIQPLREHEDIKATDVAEMLGCTAIELEASIKKLIKRKILIQGPNGLMSYWS